jgi:LDH2 family malate/lactate/ureidoglycolate dehydrogenase
MNAGETVGKGTGHFIGAMRIDAFRPAIEFKKDMDIWIQRFRNAEAVEGQKVIIPGDPERALEMERKANGIPLISPVVEDLKALSVRFNLDFKIV